MPLKTSIKQRFQRRDSGTQYRHWWQLIHIDFILLISILLLNIFGFFILYSASNEQFSLVLSQMGHISFAVIIMLVLAQLPPYWYQRWAPWFYFFSLIALLLVLIIGHISLGAQRWISLGLFRFQPSDLMLLALPMMLAWYFANKALPPNTKEVILSSLIILIPAVFTAKEPDLGSGIVIFTTGACLLLLAGIRWRIILYLLIGILLMAPFLWHFMRFYQRQRVLTFLNPERDPLGAGYHIIQSKIAIGSGGLLGKGWLMGTQSHLQFLPEHATDFIFAVCGEEFGLFGALILLLLYTAIILRCFYIASQAQDTFTRLLAGALSALFFISVFVNIGMVSGILPVVGLPLPMISYGGTSMVTLMASFGILMSIHGHKRLLS